jgi:hypothetical protein
MYIYNLNIGIHIHMLYEFTKKKTFQNWQIIHFVLELQVGQLGCINIGLK